MGRKFSYIDMMRTLPSKAVYNEEVQKHSEMLKPYKHDGYQEMEHFYPDYNFNLDFIDWNFQFPRFDGNIEAEIEDAEDYGRDRECDCWWYCLDFACDRPDKCMPTPVYSCTRKQLLTRAPLDYFENVKILRGPGTIINWNAVLCRWLPAPVAGVNYDLPENYVIFELKLKDGSSHGPICYAAYKIPNDCEECQCEDITPVTFDEDDTPDTIVKGAGVTLYIQDGCGPYTWATSSMGYTLDVLATNGLSNGLYCANGTCGVDFDPIVIVTVTDACGNTDTITLRNTSGSWTLNATECVTSTSYAYVTCYTDPYTISGSSYRLGIDYYQIGASPPTCDAVNNCCWWLIANGSTWGMSGTSCNFYCGGDDHCYGYFSGVATWAFPWRVRSYIWSC